MENHIPNIINEMMSTTAVYDEHSLTVEEVLNLPDFAGFKLLGGSSGLQNRCKHITILETPEGISWLTGGEFLLTAGYALKDREDKKSSMILDAHQRKVSAVAVKENRYFGEISKQLIDDANTYGVPLIEISRNVIYTEAISSFYNMLFYRKNEYILNLNNIYAKLLDLSFENKDVNGIIYSLSNLSNSNVFLCDRYLNPITYNIIDSSSYDKLANKIPFSKKGAPAVKEIKDYCINKEIMGVYISIYPLVRDNKPLGYVYIVNSSKLDKLAQSSIEYGISIISMKLDIDQARSFSQARLNKTLIEIMLNNKELPDEFYENVEKDLGWDREGHIVGICIKIHIKKDTHIDECKNSVYSVLNNILEKGNYLSKDKKNEVFVFTNIEARAHLEEVVSKIVASLQDYDDAYLVAVGISNVYKRIKNIEKMYNEAYLAALFSNHDSIYFNSLDTIKLLYPLKDDNEVHEYYNRTIRKLEKYDEDQGTNLLETVECYLRYNFNRKIAASKLFIHVETLRYRLNRIEEITGYSLNDTEGIFALQMGLKLKKLIKIK
ncbi:purine catabolism regulatory protein [Anaerovirgula multivorans]|uniref:Purine catabolism regulatory protein n=1 Tax=Anaerovirgula multivorans TaxID=312168 RepID=A0A239BH91_9FIRM|nr:PucR family transcriptional regulator ligand-binding domain-containing protein [Anaerovirgula multivorans]SNS07320.1 purine catabolism regulatory protein [Anaerovirgula multivorans]